MEKIGRIILIVLDSVGAGALPDAHIYGDQAANTLANVAKQIGGLSLTVMQGLGLGNIISIDGVAAVKTPKAHYGKMAEQSVGKDTTTGHWEIAGIHTMHPFRTYPDGFPEHITSAFIQKSQCGAILGNKPASGTVIIEEYGKEHMQTGFPIIYTSADSVFQIAAHEEVIPLEKLYEMCRIAREILQGEDSVARVIARPFIGTPGQFKRTSNRKDFSVSPPNKTILDQLTDAGITVKGIGKIYDIFNGHGIAISHKTADNLEGLAMTKREISSAWNGLLFVNLVDFDMLYGHRNDAIGYGKALEEVDRCLAEIIEAMQSSDLLIITADHGCDPTIEGTDHTREYVPLLVYHHGIAQGKNLEIRKTFADVAATIADVFQLPHTYNGESFYKEIM